MILLILASQVARIIDITWLHFVFV
jgi:hypothetical protein